MNLRAIAVLLLAGVTLLATLALGVVDVPWGTERAVAPLLVRPEAGGSVCPGGGGESVRAVDVVLAAPPLAAADVMGGVDATSGRGILLGVDGEVDRTAVGPFLPGAVVTERIDLGPDGWLWAGWADRPLVAWRELRSPGGPGEPRASVVARCTRADAPEWVVLGLRTDGGNEALLHIVNPYVVDATFAVSLRTEQDVVTPIALRNVSVPAGQRVTIRLNDHLPEEPEIAAVVTVGAGRLAVEGLQRATAGVGGVEGVAVMPALTAPAVTWTLPWVLTGPDVEGAVWLLNPEPRVVVVEVVVHTAQGAGLGEVLERIELPAGGFVRIDTADLAPTGRTSFGLTLRSETSAVFAAAGARSLSEDPARTGLVLLVPSATPDREWLDAGTHVPGRRTLLHVVNLSEEAADLRVALTVLAPASSAPEGTAPPAAEEVRVLEPGVLAPGAVVDIVLPLDGLSAWSALVTGGEALVVSRTTTGAELLEPVAIDALPSRAWQAPMRGLVGRAFDGWAARLGTAADLRG